MPYKDEEDQKAYHRSWYKKNKARLKKKAKKNNKLYTARNREYINQLKEETPCADCNEHYHPCQMDFDHVSDDKTMKVSQMANSSYSMETLNEEIDKCELVCANCHRLRTWERLQD